MYIYKLAWSLLALALALAYNCHRRALGATLLTVSAEETPPQCARAKQCGAKLPPSARADIAMKAMLEVVQGSLNHIQRSAGTARDMALMSVGLLDGL